MKTKASEHKIKVGKDVLTVQEFRDRIRAIVGLKPEGYYNAPVEKSPLVHERKTGWVRCPDHRNGGATQCPRGGAALQEWQRKQWGD